MRCLLAAVMLAAFVWPAGAAKRYDRKLEEQVKRIVAAKIGDIRGTLSYDRIIYFPAVEPDPDSASIRIHPSMPISGGKHFQASE